VLKDEVRILTPGPTEAGEVRESDLIKRLHDLENADYDDPMERAKARTEAHRISSQFKVAGKQVPHLEKLGH